MHRVAVIGDKDSVLAFKALGFSVRTPVEAGEVRRTIDRLAGEKCGVIFITEQLAALVPETIERYNDKAIPAIILIPNSRGTMNMGMNQISQNVEKAVGRNIF